MVFDLLAIAQDGYITQGIGGGEGLPYPVPVEMIGVENISLASAQSTQITTQTVADGIDKQVVTDQIDYQATDDQIDINTGNKCP